MQFRCRLCSVAVVAYATSSAVGGGCSLRDQFQSSVSVVILARTSSKNIAVVRELSDGSSVA